MAYPIIPGIPQAEQETVYRKLDDYNRDRASYKEAGAYLMVLPYANNPYYTLRIYSLLPERQSIFYICNLAPDLYESLRMAGTLCFYSDRRLLLVNYNAKRMQTNGDDLVSFGKYRGHYLHEVLRIDPAYLTWIAFKFQPRIPKQERFVQIAKIYYSVSLDIQQCKRKRPIGSRQYLGNVGERVNDLTLTVLRVRIEDDPYRTRVIGSTPVFSVRQVLTLTDSFGRLVTFRKASRTPSYVSAQLPAIEHAYQTGEVLHVSSATIARTYVSAGKPYTRLTRVILGKP